MCLISQINFPLKKKFCGCIKSRAGIFCDACHPLMASPHIPPSLICVKSRIKFSTDATVMSPPCWPPIALQWRHRCVFARGCRVSSKFRWIIGYDQVDYRTTLTQPTMQKIKPYFHYRYQYFWFCLWCSWYSLAASWQNKLLKKVKKSVTKMKLAKTFLRNVKKKSGTKNYIS